MHVYVAGGWQPEQLDELPPVDQGDPPATIAATTHNMNILPSVNLGEGDGNEWPVEKTRLQHALTAAALNFARTGEWLSGAPRAPAWRSPFFEPMALLAPARR